MVRKKYGSKTKNIWPELIVEQNLLQGLTGCQIPPRELGDPRALQQGQKEPEVPYRRAFS